MDELIRLSNATLGQLRSDVSVPRYDRSTLTPGIVHIGVGNFHRAHQAWYLHRLMQDGMAHDWAIIGAGVRDNDVQMRAKLLSQDCLTTLVELNPTSRSAEIIGSMIDYLPIEQENQNLIRQLSDPRIRIVTLTVTEGGYFVDPIGKDLDLSHPDIQHDASYPNRPKTAFGAIVAALKHRRESGAGPFTVMSCDNLQGNGRILRRTLLGLAKLSDPELAYWIDANCSFPNSMVDCIVPATGPRELEIATAFGLDDLVPVTHESFRQWVIEDDFCAGRPNWEQVGAVFSEDVHAFEKMKLRILNAGHQVLANVGEVLAIETIADCMAHPLISAFFRKVEVEEIAPLVAPVPGMTASSYVGLIEERFRNPSIVDTVRRVAFDGSSRHTEFLVPIIEDALEKNSSVTGLALVEAFWARMCAGTREDGSEIDANDPNWQSLTIAANQARKAPRAWLEQNHIYGDLKGAERFASAFEFWLNAIWTQGSEEALRLFVTNKAATVSYSDEILSNFR